ncbi:hypothetical protein DICVIV_12891 [Dictyocaulus viviparus]|uniref:Uncharacterized protein n=1 Tax=Dictyocaulus viviparus TaxID=29172 RepID=A0A0D8X991_DICVI|nr:hypothetical protein DICVIV_12891 [Dictyocaulus viviparus]
MHITDARPDQQIYRRPSAQTPNTTSPTRTHHTIITDNQPAAAEQQRWQFVNNVHTTTPRKQIASKHVKLRLSRSDTQNISFNQRYVLSKPCNRTQH